MWAGRLGRIPSTNGTNGLLRLPGRGWHTGLKRDLADKATFKIEQPYKLFKLKQEPPMESTITRDEALTMYTQMQTIRRMETTAANLYKAKMIRGFCHLYSGQEAVAVGIKSVMQKQDSVITSYREHGWTYIMGVPVSGVLAELTGREAGCSRGKGGSMHMYAPNFYGGNGIVGAQLPLGTGLALAHKYLEDGGVSITLYGDGAANQGQFFEALNMAKLMGLPCLYVCENNLYGMGTSAKRSSANPEYYTRGDYVSGILVDGMDVLAMREATQFAMDICRKGEPLIMEATAYRYHGHSMSDPGTSYRTREEIQDVRKQRDPIAKFKDKIVKADLVKEEEIKEIDKKIKAEVEKAAEVAQTSPEATDLFGDVYANNLEEFLRGTTPMDQAEHVSIGKPCNLN